MKRIIILIHAIILSVSAFSQTPDGNYFFVNFKEKLLTLIKYDKGEPRFVGIVGSDVTGIWIDSDHFPSHIKTTRVKIDTDYTDERANMKAQAEGKDYAYDITLDKALSLDWYKTMCTTLIRNSAWLKEGFNRNTFIAYLLKYSQLLLDAADQSRFSDLFADLYLNRIKFEWGNKGSSERTEVLDWAASNGNDTERAYLGKLLSHFGEWKTKTAESTYEWIIEMLKDKKAGENAAETDNAGGGKKPGYSIGQESTATTPPENTVTAKQGTKEPTDKKTGNLYHIDWPTTTPAGNNSVSGNSQQPTANESSTSSRAKDGDVAKNPSKAQTEDEALTIPKEDRRSTNLPYSITMKWDIYVWVGYNPRYEYHLDTKTNTYKLFSEHAAAPGDATMKDAEYQKVTIYFSGNGWDKNGFKYSRDFHNSNPRQYSDAELKALVGFQEKPTK